MQLDPLIDPDRTPGNGLNAVSSPWRSQISVLCSRWVLWHSSPTLSCLGSVRDPGSPMSLLLGINQQESQSCSYHFGNFKDLEAAFQESGTKAIVSHDPAPSTADCARGVRCGAVEATTQQARDAEAKIQKGKTKQGLGLQARPC